MNRYKRLRQKFSLWLIKKLYKNIESRMLKKNLRIHMDTIDNDNQFELFKQTYTISVTDDLMYEKFKSLPQQNL